MAANDVNRQLNDDDIPFERRIRIESVCDEVNEEECGFSDNTAVEWQEVPQISSEIPETTFATSEAR